MRKKKRIRERDKGEKGRKQVSPAVIKLTHGTKVKYSTNMIYLIPLLVIL